MHFQSRLLDRGMYGKEKGGITPKIAIKGIFFTDLELSEKKKKKKKKTNNNNNNTVAYGMLNENALPKSRGQNQLKILVLGIRLIYAGTSNVLFVCLFVFVFSKHTLALKSQRVN